MSNNIISPLNMPTFGATLSTPTLNVTGDATVFTCIWDTLSSGSGYNTSTGVFTCPMPGHYLFIVEISATGLTASHTLNVAQLIATSGTFTFSNFKISTYRSSANSAIFIGTIPIVMNLNDTAYVNWQVSNGTKVVSFDSISTFKCMRIY